MILASSIPTHELGPGEEVHSAGISHAPGAKPPDELTFYLQTIRRFPLLTLEQEQYLARCIQQGLVEQEQAQPDHQIIADGEQAQRQLIEANYRLVVSVARRDPLTI